MGTLLSISLSAQDVTQITKGVEVENLKGRTIDFSEVIKNDGGIKIVSFWATWCKPCIQELGYLNDLYDELQLDMNTTVYAVSIDDARSRKRILPFVNGKSWEFEVLIDENSTLKRKMSVLNIPHTFIIDQKNNIVYQHNSYVPGDEEEYFKVIRELN